MRRSSASSFIRPRSSTSISTHKSYTEGGGDGYDDRSTSSTSGLRAGFGPMGNTQESNLSISGRSVESGDKVERSRNNNDQFVLPTESEDIQGDGGNDEDHQ